MGDGGAGDRDLKGVGSAAEGEGGEVAAIAPAVGADPSGIGKALRDEPFHAVDLVLDFEVA